MVYLLTVSGVFNQVTPKDKLQRFDNLTDAIAAFESECVRFGYDNIEVFEDQTRQAGGFGHEYKIQIWTEGNHQKSNG